MVLERIFYAQAPPPGASDRSGTGMTRLFLLLFIPLTLALALDGALNMKWRMFHDYPTMAYYGFLMNSLHWVPYRDFVDMNMPGNHVFNAWAGRIFGYSDLGFRLLDMTVLALLIASTALWLRRLGWKVAWAAMAAFTFLYFANGPIIALQREYILLVPISLSLWAATSGSVRPGPGARSFAVGLCFGAAFLIKPHVVLGLPIVFLLLVLEERARRGSPGWFGSWMIGLACLTGVGFLLPVGGMAFSLWRNGGLGPFIEMARNYWPLYTRMTGGHEIVSAAERTTYLWKSYWEFNGLQGLFTPAALGVFLMLANAPALRPRRRLVAALLLLTFVYSLYPVLAGKFWPYHWLVFLYFLCVLAALCVVDQPGATRRILKIFPYAAFLLAVFVQPPMWRALAHQVRGEVYYDEKIERGDAMAAFLRARLRPGDRVQPLDWTGGTHQAMLAVRAELATPFLVDSCFYHDLSNPFIQRLRRRFLDSLQAAKPRFILRVLKRDMPRGPDTTSHFLELEEVLYTQYRPVAADLKLGYIIYERRP